MNTTSSPEGSLPAEGATGALRHEIAARLRAIEPAGSPLSELVVGLSVAAGATGMRWLLDSWLEHRLPYVFPIAAVSIASRLGSWRAGLVCGLVSFLLANYLFVEPRLQLHGGFEDVVTALAVAFLMGVILVLSHRSERAARAVDVLTRRMADADQQKTNFLAVLAHELRNPLSALRMAADLLRRSPLGDRECRAVESIGRQLSQVDRLVKDLSDASLINQGKVVLERTDQKLAALVGAAVESVQECLRARQQQAEVNVPPDIVVHVDASRIVQVLTNLLHNASKFSPAGGVIRITAQGDAVQVAMKVEDAGAGIPHDRLEWIFDSYAQLNPAGGGLGLGLSLVRKLVVLHGGQVRALSRGPGQGSTFELTLPRVR